MRFVLLVLETIAVAALAVVIAFWLPGPVGFGTSGVGLVLTIVWVVGLSLLALRDFRR